MDKRNFVTSDIDKVFAEEKKKRKFPLYYVLGTAFVILVLVLTTVYYKNLYVPIDNNLKASGQALNEVNSSINGIVNINTADITSLCTLYGIGESKALSIINYREINGNFKDKRDILNVSGIGDKIYDKIKDKICV